MKKGQDNKDIVCNSAIRGKNRLKKIGVVTVYNICNYGSSLQAYALQYYLKEIGFDPYILDRSEKNHFWSLLWKGIRAIKCAPKIITNYQYYSNQKRIYHGAYQNDIGLETKNAIKRFDLEKLQVLHLSTPELLLMKYNKEFLWYIAGSDQIWSPISLYVSPLAFLQWFPRNKRIAYAPSFGIDTIPEANKKTISHYITSIPYLSAREENGRRNIADLTGRDVPLVLDPTLLMTGEEWKSIAKDVTGSDIQKYAVLYFLERPNNEILSSILSYCKLNKLEIFQVYRKHTDNYFLNVDPLGFVRMIENASYVFTDSFHGTAFAINFGVPFFVFERNHRNGAPSQISRIMSLLYTLGLQSRMVDGQIDFSIECSFDHAWTVLEELRKQSKEFLEPILLESKQ